MKKIVIRHLVFMVFLAISACSTPMEREYVNFNNDWNNYFKSVSDEKGKTTVSDSVFYNELLAIAKRHQQSGFEKVFRMLNIEAVKKEHGLQNQYDALETRLKNADTSLFGFAEAYEVNINAESKCSQFGYTKNTPDFNKCVYEYKVTYANLMLQQQQLMMQMMSRPAPLIIPAPTHTQTNTDCTPTYGGGFSCSSR